MSERAIAGVFTVGAALAIAGAAIAWGWGGAVLALGLVMMLAAVTEYAA